MKHPELMQTVMENPLTQAGELLTLQLLHPPTSLHQKIPVAVSETIQMKQVNRISDITRVDEAVISPIIVGGPGNRRSLVTNISSAKDKDYDAVAAIYAEAGKAAG